MTAALMELVETPEEHVRNALQILGHGVLNGSGVIFAPSDIESIESRLTRALQSPPAPTRADDLQATARDAIRRIESTGERVAQAYATVQDLADGRAVEKSAAIIRLMQTTNAETTKPHSASSAEKIVESDAEYSAYRRRERDAEVEKHRAEAAYSASKLTARLEVELYTAFERNS